MHVPSLIEKKRDGRELAVEEIAAFVRGFVRGEIPDYQVSALAMAVFFRGMSATEVAGLTKAMRDSGRVFRWPADSPPKVDKHSTGGVGDKVSLILAPLLACAGVWVPMVSGRGLGITGGTLDKLESIPGFRVGLSEAEALHQLEKIGVVMMGQTSDFCPADKKLYALRDVTGTVPSIPLIVASIMSKKLAESLDRLVLDVKFGSGAFMKTKSDAEALACALVSVGNECGLQATAVLTPMHQPLGRTAGNALEVWESMETLQGRGPADLVELTLELAEKVTTVSRAQLRGWLKDGEAWRKWCALVEAQGGSAVETERILQVHRAPIVYDLLAKENGTVARVDAEGVGRACVALGAGRAFASDQVDYAVGCSEIIKEGTAVQKGSLMMRIHARDEARLKQALEFIEAGLAISE